jgi:hypothetical protein
MLQWLQRYCLTTALKCDTRRACRSTGICGCQHGHMTGALGSGTVVLSNSMSCLLSSLQYRHRMHAWSASKTYYPRCEEILTYRKMTNAKSMSPRQLSPIQTEVTCCGEPCLLTVYIVLTVKVFVCCTRVIHFFGITTCFSMT